MNPVFKISNWPSEIAVKALIPPIALVFTFTPSSSKYPNSSAKILNDTLIFPASSDTFNVPKSFFGAAVVTFELSSLLDVVYFFPQAAKAPTAATANNDVPNIFLIPILNSFFLIDISFIIFLFI